MLHKKSKFKLCELREIIIEISILELILKINPSLSQCVFTMHREGDSM